MRQYETTFILRPNLGEDQFTEIIERTCSIITDDGGVIIDTDRWGIKRLAYEINKEVQGYYVCLNYAAPGTTIAELERIFRIDDRVLRFLTIKLADSIDADGINREKEGFAARAEANTEEAEGEENGDGVEDDTKSSEPAPEAKQEDTTSSAKATEEQPADE